MKEISVYVVYFVEDNDLVDVRVFNTYAEAKWFVKTAKEEKGREYCMWQRPIEDYKE